MIRFRIFHDIMLVYLVSYATAKWNKYSVFMSPNVRFTDIIEHYLITSKTRCLSFCDRTDDCLSVNYNSDMDKCELTSYVPRVLTPVSTTEPNWTVYYRDDRMVSVVAAWQMSTYTGVNRKLSADLAIDGNRDNNYAINCAHTKDFYSYWAMKFERVEDVSYVIIYFRSDSAFNYRNTNLRLLVSATKHDSDNNVGTVCGTYVGPPETPSLPVKVKCTRHITGQFLKIIHDSPNPLTLCEVEVYSA